ncbi:MAG: radical SAM protein [Cytophagales bacterium]|nr:radical SAM protein [Armatimonadota bacterium]
MGSEKVAGQIAATERPAAARLREARDGSAPGVGPQSIGVVLTNACNLNCITCWSYSPLRRELPTLDWRRRRLSRETLRALFEDAAALRAERVIFTGGGDPLAHPEFYDIAADAKAMGLKVTLISNLTLARDRARLLALRLDTVLANFSCGDAETYAAFHPNRAPADFAPLLDTLRAVAAGGAELKLVFVVCAINAHVLPRAVAIAGQLGASLQFKRVSITDETRSLDLSTSHQTALLAQLPALRSQSSALKVAANWDVFAAELRGSERAESAATVEETGCWAGHYYGRVSASGDVSFCCNQNPALRVGSLHEASFEALWTSPRWQEIRDRLRAGSYVAGCAQCGKMDLNHRVASQIRGTALRMRGATDAP